MRDYYTDDWLVDRINEAKLEHGLYPGSLFRHRSSGRLYAIEGITLLESDLTQLVAYRAYAIGEHAHSSRNRALWSRPLKEFVDRFEKLKV